MNNVTTACAPQNPIRCCSVEKDRKTLEADIRKQQSAANELLTSLGFKITDKKTRIDGLCLSLEGDERKLLIKTLNEASGHCSEQCGLIVNPTVSDRDTLTTLLIEKVKNEKKLKSQLQCKQRALESSRLEAADLQEQNRCLEAQVAALEGKLQGANVELDSKKLEIAGLKEKNRKNYETASEEISNLQVQETGLSKEMANLKIDLEKSKKLIAALRCAIKRLRKLQSELKELQKKEQESSEKLSSAKTDLGKCREKLAEKNDSHARAVERIEKLEKMLEKCELKLKASADELEREKASSSSLKDKLKKVGRHFKADQEARRKLGDDLERLFLYLKQVIEKLQLGFDELVIDDPSRGFHDCDGCGLPPKIDGAEVNVRVESVCGFPDLSLEIANLTNLCKCLRNE